MKNIIRMLNSAQKNNEPIFILRAKDKNSIEAIETYLKECKNSSPKQHIKEIEQILLEFKEWQKENPKKTKYPD